MISEVLNAIFLTFLLTEYLIATNDDILGGAGSTTGKWTATRVLKWQNLAAIAVLASINLVERVSGAASVLSTVLHRLLHLPKILLVLMAYVVALYVDCRRVNRTLPLATFLHRTGVAFMQILPIYPLLAILISFGFLVVINLFEFLHLPLDLLNRPIYYGTLYGPFSLVYWNVKRRVLYEATSLPSASSYR